MIVTKYNWKWMPFTRSDSQRFLQAAWIVGGGRRCRSQPVGMCTTKVIMSDDRIQVGVPYMAEYTCPVPSQARIESFVTSQRFHLFTRCVTSLVISLTSSFSNFNTFFVFILRIGSLFVGVYFIRAFLLVNHALNHVFFS